MNYGSQMLGVRSLLSANIAGELQKGEPLKTIVFAIHSFLDLHDLKGIRWSSLIDDD